MSLQLAQLHVYLVYVPTKLIPAARFSRSANITVALLYTEAAVVLPCTFFFSILFSTFSSLIFSNRKPSLALIYSFLSNGSHCCKVELFRTRIPQTLQTIVDMAMFKMLVYGESRRNVINSLAQKCLSIYNEMVFLDKLSSYCLGQYFSKQTGAYVIQLFFNIY